MTTLHFEFEELCPRDSKGRSITGMMLSGTAELTDDNDTDWHIASVTLENAGTIKHNHTAPFDAAIFKIVADEISDSRTELGEMACEAWAKELESAAQDHAEGLADYQRDLRMDA